MIELSEAEVKSGVEEYLQYQQNQGKLWFARLNAGNFIEVRGGSRRRIKGAGKGTADYIVIQGGQVHLEYMGQQKGPVIPVALVTFVECKSTKGKQSQDQYLFQTDIERLHCRYHIVRSVDELQEVLE